VIRLLDRQKIIFSAGLLFIASNAVTAQTGRPAPASGEQRLQITQREQTLVALAKRVTHVEARQTSYVDSLWQSISEVAGRGTRTLAAMIDSLTDAARDSLSPQRKDSLRALQRTMNDRIKLLSVSWSTSLSDVLLQYKREVRQLHFEAFSLKTAPDWGELLESKQDQFDSLMNVYRDSITAVHDTYRDEFQDVVDATLDSLQTYRDILVDHQVDEWAAHVPALFTALSYQTHVTYRGRDAGIEQNAFGPAVEWRLLPTARVRASAVSFNKSLERWAEAEVGASYRFPFGALSGLTASYTRYWFNDSSVVENDNLHNNLSAELLIASRAVNIDLVGGISFSSGSEFTSSLAFSHEFDFETASGRVSVSIEPTLTATLGGQKGELLESIVQPGPGGPVVTTTTQQVTTFSILSYEFSIPATIQIGSLALSPTITYVIPKNVVDISRQTSFVSIALALSAGFY
jgi:hypothetical protein